ncbi:MAG: hypothetical protein KDJ35_06835 [Alphaproteobacteria bacterium]|nr:hypothetical protein [Alphaproteobacteria bacterium]
MSKYSKITSGEVQSKLRNAGWWITEENTSKRDFNKVCLTIDRVPGKAKYGGQPDVKIRLSKDDNQRLPKAGIKIIEHKSGLSFG